MRGMRSFGSVLTCSGWGFSHIERFRPLRMTIRGERKGFHLGDTLHVLELAVLYTIRVGPWRRAAPKAQDRVPRRVSTLRSGMKNDMRRSVFLCVMRAEVEGSFLQTGKTWVRERRKRKHQGVV